MQVPTWRSVSKLRSSAYPFHHWVLFHSTPASYAKWKGKFDCDKDEGRGGQQSKNYVRYVVRRKRADAKRALNDFLLKGMQSKQSVQDEWATWYSDSKRNSDTRVEDISDDFGSQDHPSHSKRCKPNRTTPKKPKQNGRKSKKKWSFVSEDDDGHSETTFEATFGDKSYTWSFRTWDGFGFRNSTTGFQWRDGTNWTKNGRGPMGTKGKDQASSSTNSRKSWECESDFDDDDNHDDKSRTIGSYSHRVMLGLPPTGPLQMDDVKTAFRASALKWHPDKHQGPSQAMAGEKFKSCVEAYKSLSSALGSASA